MYLLVKIVFKIQMTVARAVRLMKIKCFVIRIKLVFPLLLFTVVFFFKVPDFFFVLYLFYSSASFVRIRSFIGKKIKPSLPVPSYVQYIFRNLKNIDNAFQ